jgi:hypothetical protein
MSAEGTSSADGRVLPDIVTVREWRWRLIPYLVSAGALGIAFAVAVAIFVFHGQVAPGLIVGGVVVLGGLAVYASFVYRRDDIREVRISRVGVTFVLGRESIAVPWATLQPPKHRLFFGDIGFFFPKELGPRFAKKDSERGAVAVTRRQALAILSHPGCPAWPINPKIRRSLGMTPRPPVGP